ncbi:MAG: hypothetical protein KDC05_06605 [Bacteroidales bacterium]|nr:hypothetical protein [Bacteroidales bacterium]
MRYFTIVACLIFLQTFSLGQSKLKIAPPNPDYLNFLEERKSNPDMLVAPNPNKLGYSEYYKMKKGQSPESYPVAFDLRTAGAGGTSFLTPVKHQLSCGACWAFATYGSIEGTWKMAGYGDYDLSENNLKNCSGFDLNPCQWGHHFMSTAYLVRGSGPIAEADDPYQPDNDTCQPGMNPEFYVPESRYLPEDHDAFKETIMNIGPVYNTFRSIPANYTWIYDQMVHCYQGASSTSHAIAIVGWNDTITTTCGKGGWLVKDQYGTNWGDGGFYYISYQDTLVLKYNAIWPYREEFDPEMYIYQYDTIGGWPFVGYEDPVAYGLIRFDAVGDQFISDVGTYTVGYGTTLEVKIFDDFSNGTVQNLLASAPAKYCDYPGFWRIPLEQPIRVNEGEDFYIQIKYTSPGEDFPMAIETLSEGYTIPSIETDKCWASEDGETWEDCGTGTLNEFDLCIKAYGYDITRLNVKVYLEGPFQGTAMSAFLSNHEDFPLHQPYLSAPWNYNGDESLEEIPEDVVDWLLLELRETDGDISQAGLGNVVARKAVLLLQDGSVTDADGMSLPAFNVSPKDNLYVVVYHRNHIPVISSEPLQKSGGVYSWNFTDGPDKAYGGLFGQKQVGSNNYAMWGGDATASGTVDITDLQNNWQTEAGKEGYLPADFNLDTQIGNDDKNDIWKPNEGSSSQVPD